MSRKQWAVKFHKQLGSGESRSSLSKPRTAVGARLLKLLSPDHPGYSRTIVNYDDEVRAWGRHDWVMHPTEDDLRKAEVAAKHVIPTVAAGESIRLEVQLEETLRDEASGTLGPGAR